MPKTLTRGGRLLERLNQRYARPALMASALGLPAEKVRMWRHRGRVPPEYWERVESHLDGTAQRVQPKPLLKVATMDDDLARRFHEFAHLLINEPGFKELLLRHGWASEDRKVVSDVIDIVERETD